MARLIPCQFHTEDQSLPKTMLALEISEVTSLLIRTQQETALPKFVNLSTAQRRCLLAFRIDSSRGPPEQVAKSSLSYISVDLQDEIVTGRGKKDHDFSAYSEAFKSIASYRCLSLQIQACSASRIE